MNIMRVGEATSPLLSILMLVGNKERWKRFVPKRLREMQELFTVCRFSFEVVFVINGECNRDLLLQDLEGMPFAVTVLFHGINRISRARNLAAEYARGEFVLVWDDDDALLTPDALPEFLDQYSTLPVGVLCAELTLGDGRGLHPQNPVLMPQRRWKNPKLLLTGMQHTPFVARRSILTSFPLSEVRELRGEWLEWSVRLWRGGIPIGYVSTPSCVFSDQNGKGQSATRRMDAFAYTLVSLLCISYEYRLIPGTFAAEVLYRRYAEQGFGQHCRKPLEAWIRFLEAGQRLEDSNNLVTDFGNAGQSFQFAWEFTRQSRALLDQGRRRIEKEQVYPISPFGFFEENHGDLFHHCMENARGRLRTFDSCRIS